MANVGTADAGKTLISDGQGKSPTFAAIGTKSGLAAHGVVVAENLSAFNVVGPTSTAGQVFQSAGASADPAFSNASYPSSTTINQLLYSSSTNTISGLATNNDGVLITSHIGVPSILANGSAGQIFTANTNAPPSWQNAPSTNISITGDSGGALSGTSFTFTASTIGLSFSGASTTQTLGGTLNATHGGTAQTSWTTGDLLYASASNTLSKLTIGSTNQVLSVSSGIPAWSAPPASFTWQNITSGQTMAVNNGYAITSGACSLALPTTSAVGSVIEVVLAGGTSWTITQAANQQIFMGSNQSGAVSTTSGVGGSLASVRAGDWIKLVCITANLAWQACVLQGDAITVV